MEERLQKYMAECGVGSRRRCEEYIKEGKVKVNGVVVTEMGTKIDPDKDSVEYSGKKLTMTQPHVTVMLNKPAGYVTTSHDQFNRPDVTQLVDIEDVRLYPVGRLDYQTTGLLLLTNDGDLAYKMTHPAKKVDKVYEATLKGEMTLEALRRLESGVKLDDGFITSPAKVKVHGLRNGNTNIEITIHEGKNHEVRRMAEAVGFPVLRLKRIQEGSLKLGMIKEGAYRVLSEKEVKRLKDEAQ